MFETRRTDFEERREKKVSILWYPAANSDADSEFYRLFWNAAVYQFVETLQYRNGAGPADPGDPVDDRDLFWLLSGLDCKLSDCRKQRERICLAVLCSRCSGAACLYGILSAAADNERKAVDPGTGILESDACVALPDGCGGQFVPIDSLPEQLVLLYRSPWKTGDSALVSAVLFWAALAVFVSTLTTKQHVIADVIGGALLAEVTWQIAGRTHLGAWYGMILERRRWKRRAE